MSIQRVKERAEEADEMIRQLAAQNAEQGEEVEEAGEDVESAEVTVLETATQQHVADSDEGATDELAELRAELEKERQRYRSLDGMIRAANDQVETYKEMLANLKANEPQAQSAPPAPTGHTGADVEAFGEDLIDLMQRISREVAAKEIGEMRKTLEGLQGEMQGVSQQTALTAQEQFERNLDQLAPQWRTLDSDQKFIDWLQESPAIQKVFADAAKAFDAKSVADVFKMYAQVTGQVQQKTAERRQKVEQQTAPPKTRTNPPPAQTPPEEKIWTRSEIADFYKRGRKLYSSDEYAAVERQIEAALRSNRVDHTQ